MSPRAAPAGPRHGFTLVELLVVIAIVAVLAGMLLPALGKARAAATAVSCASNHRQVMISLLLYGNESDDLIAVRTPVEKPGEPGKIIAPAWNEVLTGGLWRLNDETRGCDLLPFSGITPYLAFANRRMLVCPLAVDGGDDYWEEYNTNGLYYPDFDASTYAANTAATGDYWLQGTGEGAMGRARYYRLPAMRAASRTFLFADTALLSVDLARPQYLWRAEGDDPASHLGVLWLGHTQRVQVSAADGHTAGHTARELRQGPMAIQRFKMQDNRGQLYLPGD